MVRLITSSGECHDHQTYDGGHLDWNAVEKSFNAQSVQLGGGRVPGCFTDGSQRGLTRDCFDVPELMVTVIKEGAPLRS